MPTDIARRRFLFAFGSAAAWPLARAHNSPARSRASACCRPAIARAIRKARRASARSPRRSASSAGTTAAISGSRCDGRTPTTTTGSARYGGAGRIRAGCLVISSNMALAVQRWTDNPDRVRADFGPGRKRLCRQHRAPDGNITGFQNFEPAVAGKWLGLLKEVAPTITRVGVTVVSGTRRCITNICGGPRPSRRRSAFRFRHQHRG